MSYEGAIQSMTMMVAIARLVSGEADEQCIGGGKRCPYYR
jgi:hypothetical protein